MRFSILFWLLLSPFLFNAQVQSFDNYYTYYSNQEAYFFDSIIKVWVAPVDGCWVEEEYCEYNPCTKQNETRTRTVWDSGHSGYYRNQSYLYLRKDGVVYLASYSVLKKELTSNPETRSLFNKYDKGLSTLNFGGTMLVVGAGLFFAPICLEMDIDNIGSEYFVVTGVTSLLGGMIFLAGNSTQKNKLDQAIHKYNGYNSTQKLKLQPRIGFDKNGMNGGFGLKLNIV